MEYVIGTIILVGTIFFIIKYRIKKAWTKESSVNSNVNNNSNESLIKKAWEQFITKNYTEAIKELDNIIEIYKIRTKGTLELRAMVCDQLEFYLDAIEDYNEALRLDNSDANNYFLRGLAKAKIGEYSDAKNDFEKAVFMKPNIGLYKQQLILAEAMEHPGSEEFAKKIAIKNGKLKRRVKSSELITTIEVKKVDVKHAIELELEDLRLQLESNPDNQDLKELLRIAERRYSEYSNH